MGSGDHMGLHEKMIQLNQAVQKYTGKSGTTAVPDMIKRLGGNPLGITTISEALTTLADCIRKIGSTKSKLTIDDMIRLLQNMSKPFEDTVLFDQSIPIKFGSSSYAFTTPLPSHIGQTIKITVTAQFIANGNGHNLEIGLTDGQASHTVTLSKTSIFGYQTLDYEFYIKPDDTTVYSKILVNIDRRTALNMIKAKATRTN